MSDDTRWEYSQTESRHACRLGCSASEREKSLSATIACFLDAAYTLRRFESFHASAFSFLYIIMTLSSIPSEGSYIVMLQNFVQGSR